MLLYGFNLACLGGALFLLRGLLGGPDRGQLCPDLRVLLLPVVVCSPVIGLTLIRGQVDLLLLFLLAAFVACLTWKRPFAAGMFLATAICIKLIPAFLLVLPLWRRDGRCLAGCFAGLVVGLGLVPAAVFGTDRTIVMYERLLNVLVRPAMGVGDDDSRGLELLDARKSVNQSFQMTIHLAMHLNEPHIPARPAAWIRGVHWLLVAFFTVLILWRQGRSTTWDGQQLVGITGLLIVVMLLASPVCHLHYFTLVVPLAMAVVARLLSSAERGAKDKGRRLVWSIPLVLVPVAYIVHMAPPFPSFRDLAVPMYATLSLWLTGWLILRARPSQDSDALPARRQAA